jgi:hypothetical protein
MRKAVFLALASLLLIIPVTSQEQMVMEHMFSKESAGPTPGVSISGSIVAGEEAIPGLRVELYDPQGNFIHESSTDDQGTFYFHGLSENEAPYVFKIFWGKDRLIAERQLIVFKGLKDIVLRLK